MEKRGRVLIAIFFVLVAAVLVFTQTTLFEDLKIAAPHVANLDANPGLGPQDLDADKIFWDAELSNIFDPANVELRNGATEADRLRLLGALMDNSQYDLHRQAGVMGYRLSEPALPHPYGIVLDPDPGVAGRIHQGDIVVRVTDTVEMVESVDHEFGHVLQQVLTNDDNLINHWKSDLIKYTAHEFEAELFATKGDFAAALSRIESNSPGNVAIDLIRTEASVRGVDNLRPDQIFAITKELRDVNGCIDLVPMTPGSVSTLTTGQFRGSFDDVLGTVTDPDWEGVKFADTLFPGPGGVTTRKKQILSTGITEVWGNIPPGIKRGVARFIPVVGIGAGFVAAQESFANDEYIDGVLCAAGTVIEPLDWSQMSGEGVNFVASLNIPFHSDSTHLFDLGSLGQCEVLLGSIRGDYPVGAFSHDGSVIDRLAGVLQFAFPSAWYNPEAEDVGEHSGENQVELLWDFGEGDTELLNCALTCEDHCAIEYVNCIGNFADATHEQSCQVEFEDCFKKCSCGNGLIDDEDSEERGTYDLGEQCDIESPAENNGCGVNEQCVQEVPQEEGFPLYCQCEACPPGTEWDGESGECVLLGACCNLQVEMCVGEGTEEWCEEQDGRFLEGRTCGNVNCELENEGSCPLSQNYCVDTFTLGVTGARMVGHESGPILDLSGGGQLRYFIQYENQEQCLDLDTGEQWVTPHGGDPAIKDLGDGYFGVDPGGLVACAGGDARASYGMAIWRGMPFEEGSRQVYLYSTGGSRHPDDRSPSPPGQYDYDVQEPFDWADADGKVWTIYPGEISVS